MNGLVWTLKEYPRLLQFQKLPLDVVTCTHFPVVSVDGVWISDGLSSLSVTLIDTERKKYDYSARKSGGNDELEHWTNCKGTEASINQPIYGSLTGDSHGTFSSIRLRSLTRANVITRLIDSIKTPLPEYLKFVLRTAEHETNFSVF